MLRIHQTKAIEIVDDGFARRVLLRIHQTREIENHNEGFCAEGSAPYPSSNMKEYWHQGNCNNETLQVIAELLISLTPYDPKGSAKVSASY